jgi:hypothetical protein
MTITQPRAGRNAIPLKKPSKSAINSFCQSEEWSSHGGKQSEVTSRQRVDSPRPSTSKRAYSPLYERVIDRIYLSRKANLHRRHAGKGLRRRRLSHVANLISPACNVVYNEQNLQELHIPVISDLITSTESYVKLTSLDQCRFTYSRWTFNGETSYIPAITRTLEEDSKPLKKYIFDGHPAMNIPPPWNAYRRIHSDVCRSLRLSSPRIHIPRQWKVCLISWQICSV